jgi:hypothetical protein
MNIKIIEVYQKRINNERICKKKKKNARVV